MGKVIGFHGGNGGFGREVLKWAIPTYRDHYDKMVIVNDFAEPGKQEMQFDLPVLTRDAFLELDAGDLFFAILIADPAARKRIWTDYENRGLTPATLIAPSADVNTDVSALVGAVLCQNTVITTDVKIGKGFQANIYSYVAHDCELGDFVSFAPRVSCNGNVHIENGAYIGTSAILREGKPGHPLMVGEDAVVGMGAVVTKPVEPGTVVVGNPARPLTR